jgi:hypothetical protein
MTIFGVKELGKMTFKIMTFYRRMLSIIAYLQHKVEYIISKVTFRIITLNITTLTKMLDNSK